MNDCFPEYFATQQTSNGYHIFQNTIYQSTETNNVPTSILWPIVNATLGSLSHFHATTILKKRTLSRTWISRTYHSCMWSHVGKEIEMMKANGMCIIIPVITITDSEVMILPYNNLLMYPSGEMQGILPRRSNDIPARLYITEPVDTVPSAAAKRAEYILAYPLFSVAAPVVQVAPVATAPVPTAPVATAPVAPVVQVAQVAAVPVAPVVPSQYVTFAIPPHVKKLLVTDMISRKECCPISSEEITHENAAVTSCGHVFIANEISRWLSMDSSKNLCPICKQKCTV